MGLNLIQECQRALTLVEEDVEDGILYMDAGCGEAFHFNGGLPSLLELGARAICSLEQASALDAVISWRVTEREPAEKIVILTSRLLTESHEDIIRCLRLHPSARRCAIWTSISEEAHSAHPDTNFGLGAFDDYKNSLVRDLGKQMPIDRGQKRTITKSASRKKSGSFDEQLKDGNDATDEGSKTVDQALEAPDIKVKHFPIMVCSFTKSLFVLPSKGSVSEAPLSLKGDRHAVSRALPGFDLTTQSSAEEHIPAGATLLAHCLHSLTAQMDLKCEVFTLGPLAHAVGKAMSGLSNPPEGVHPRRSAGLVLVDRSLDLITPSCHGDSLYDRFFSYLPRRASPAHAVEINHLYPNPSCTTERAPMDVRIPVQSDEEKTTRTATTLEPCFPLFPTTEWRGGSDLQNRSGSGPPVLNEVDVNDAVSTQLTTGRTDMLGGSISSTLDQRGAEYVDTLLGKKTKESILLIRKWLQDALRQENVNFVGKVRLGAASTAELRSLRRLLSAKPEMALRHMTLIELSRAAEFVLGGQLGSQWDAFCNAERVLMLCAGDSTQSLVLQLQDIVQQYAHSKRRSEISGAESSDDLLSLRDALTLAIVGYGLAGEDAHVDSHDGPFAWEEEKALKETVLDAIMRGSPGAALGFLQNLEGALSTFLQQREGEERQSPNAAAESQQSPSTDEDWDRWDGPDPSVQDDKESKSEEYGEVQLKLELRDRLEEVFIALHKVAGASSRSPLQGLPLPGESQYSMSGLRTGLIYKLLSLIFAKVEIPGLEYHASGMGRFFKSGLGRFGLRQAKPKVVDQKVLLIFVIGGLNFAEVREARDAQAAVPGAEGIELLMGGTTLLTPSDMYGLALGSCGSV